MTRFRRARRRMRGVLVTASLGLAVLVSVVPAAHAQAPVSTDPVAEALARPISPGSVALLLPYISRPKVVERVAEALGDERPEVRAVAARVAFVTRNQQLVPALVTALAKENSPLAGAEVVRALALILGSPADDALFEQADRLGPRVAEAWVETVDRTRPVDVLPRLASLKRVAGPSVAALLDTSADAVVQAFAPLPTSPALASAYDGVLDAIRYREIAIPAGFFEAGLRTTGGVRRGTVQAMLTRQTWKLPNAAAAERELAALLDSNTPGGDPYLALVSELARRRDGHERRPLGGTIAVLDRAAVPVPFWRDALLNRLDRSEEDALRTRTGDWLPGRDRWERADGRPGERFDASKKGPVTRLIHPLTPTLVAEVAALTGCPIKPSQVLAVQLAFRPTGQVREVYAPVGNGVERCGLAARVLSAFELAWGRGPIAPERTDLVLIGFRPEDVDCPRVDPRSRSTPTRTGGAVRAPKKLREVEPHYPQELIARRIQGAVVIEAIVAPTGCIADAVVIESRDVTLDAAALAGVSAWQYEPTLVDGAAVPIVMTITINFMLP